ncbi:hypothetical protein DQ04_04361010 [Trypanosoma grayi]|uniref:hypothetical protein n=1 Tax=Trypanosoma grayi TaxID=71804 RepID=UPI0004F482FF|nr:hypothetical protein DQ04_04361010 [Trypanosoma grayi]KEG09971.1 hypothetical protein DQ04_04361010 [Trypanosoma grayi]
MRRTLDDGVCTECSGRECPGVTDLVFLNGNSCRTGEDDHAVALQQLRERAWEETVGEVLQWVAGALHGDEQSLLHLDILLEELGDAAPPRAGGGQPQSCSYCAAYDDSSSESAYPSKGVKESSQTSRSSSITTTATEGTCWSTATAQASMTEEESVESPFAGRAWQYGVSTGFLPERFQRVAADSSSGCCGSSRSSSGEGTTSVEERKEHRNSFFGERAIFGHATEKAAREENQPTEPRFKVLDESEAEERQQPWWTDVRASSRLPPMRPDDRWPF